MMNWRWPLFVTYCFFLLYLSIGAWNVPTVITWGPQDKWIHFFLYFGLGWLGQSALFSWQKRVTLLLYLGAVLIAFSYGLFTELVQYFLPERSFEWLDLFSDTVGGSVGAFSYLVARGRLTKK